MLKKLFFGLFVALFLYPSFALAEVPKREYWSHLGGTPYPSAMAACQVADPRTLGILAQSAPPVSSYGCKLYADGTGPNIALVNKVLVCPADSTSSGSTTCECTAPSTEGMSADGFPDCSGGGGPEPQRQCPVADGDQYSFNRTEGYSTSGAAGSPVNFLPPVTGQSYDTGSCVVTWDGELHSDACYRSQVPTANGLYRVSCDYTATVSGDTTGTPTDDAADPNSAPPPCPGVTGEVNGVPVCIGTSNNPLPPGTSPPDAGSNPSGTGNPPAGSLPEGQGTSDGGEVRTPATGNGGPSGGPAAAAAPPGTGTGTNPEGTEEGTPCGAPGQPVCAVKVDEKGTPAASLGSSAFDGVNQAMSETGVEEIELFRFVRDSEVLLPYSWTFQLPTGCSPYPMQGFGLTIDICEFQPTIHDLMSLLWAAAGIFGLISIFRSSFA